MIEPRRPALTLKRLRAMESALAFVLAGEHNTSDGHPPERDLEAALDWVQAQIRKRRHA